MVSIAYVNGSVVTREGVVAAPVVVSDGVVVSVGGQATADEVVDVSGCVVMPGFVDLHTHLREPGKEEAETILTGSRAGARGGYTALVAMPNTNPAQDSVMVVEFVRAQGVKAGFVDVVPSGCITVGRQGEALAPFADLRGVGVTLFTDDGNGVQDPLLMRRALEYARDLGITLAQHCEVSALTKGAVMHECSCSTDLGLPGWPALAEELMVHRDIELVRLTGAKMHFLHLSTARSVELVRRAKQDGLPVTAEVTPHHLSLTSELLRSFDSTFKVNPPLRTMSDIDALKEGVLDGTIDAIATDHAPHVRREKELPLDQAPPGMIGLETALGVVQAELNLSPERLAQVMSINPARIASLPNHGQYIAQGSPANFCVVDL
ncbi:MAG: dihydroorotase, partial [Actinobacteria bacterium]|nr:dihydroorotase [Actinomycetota bacterium]